jgi:nucleotide-binding universal stress UspA family protein
MHDLLVRATRLDDQDAGVRVAAELAAGMRASLTALYVIPAGIAPISTSYDGGAMFAEYARELARLTEEAQRHAPVFSAWASSLGAANPAWLASAGDVADALAYAGNWHDLLVLPLDDGSADPWAGPAGVARVILRAALPCLVLPRGASLAPRVQTIAVAWNGSIESIRALHAALPLLAEARRVVILLGKRKELLEPLPAFALEQWCAAHIPHVEYAPLDDDANDGPAILAAAHAASAGLLVMGAYGRSRFSEWVLGGVTRHMLEHADLPLLMRH